MIINPDTQYNRITNSIEQDVNFWVRKTESAFKNSLFGSKKLKVPPKTHFLSSENRKRLQKLTFWARKTENAFKNSLFGPGKLKVPSKTQFLSPENWKCLQKLNFWVRKTESALKNPIFESGKPKAPSKTQFLSKKRKKPVRHVFRHHARAFRVFFYLLRI